MKLFFSIILATVIIFNSAAQSLDSSVKYIWKNEATNITASVKIYGLQQTNKSFCIFYLNSVDTVYNNISDSLFNAFVNISMLNCPVIKINFYNVADTVSGKKIKLYAEEFSKFILNDVQKKYPRIRTHNLIVSGVDYFAMVALSAAIDNPQKINKTALFFHDIENTALLGNVSVADAKKLKGKLYLYINSQNKEDKLADSLANDLALNSTIVLYKFVDFGSLETSSIFKEAYNWLLADGNNYIIRNND